LSTNSGKKVRDFLILAIVALGMVHLLFRLLPGLFETWNSQVLDRFFLARSSYSTFRPAYDPAVVHIDLSDTSIRDLKTFHLTRSHYAQVVHNLASMHAAAQAYDFVFPAEMNQTDDQALMSAVSEAGNVYFGMTMALVSGQAANNDRLAPEIHEYLDGTRWKVRVEGNLEDFYSGTRPTITFPLLARASRGIGFLTLKTDPDGVLRRVPLLVRYEDGFYPSLPFRVVCDYLGVPPEHITLDPGRFIRLEGAHRPGSPPKDLDIPIDRQGNMIVNFIGPWESMSQPRGSMFHYDFARIYSASGDRDELQAWTEALSGKIAVVSDVSTGASDIGPVPVDVSFPFSGLHANVIHTILTGKFLREVSGPETTAVELGIVLIILLMSLRLSPFIFIAGSAILITGYGFAALLLFLMRGLMLQVIGPIASAAVAASLMMAYQYFQDAKEKESLRRSFESYFPPSVVKKILLNPGMLNKGQRKELTILFSDIKDFTVHASSLSPDELRNFLNEYFEAMVEIVFAHKGTVDKYIGDGLMVFFGDPEPLPDHALRAVQAAMAMQRKARELTEKWLEKEGFPVQIRIGINTGEVVVGNMGSSRRLSYTVLGSAVNLAKRLESSAPVNGILISQRTRELVQSSVPLRFLGKIQVKGIEDPVSTFEAILAD
jgi:adenylate cyclase